jgi:hypothetical protein
MFFIIIFLLLPIQLYGSTVLCDPSLNLTNLTDCGDDEALLSNMSPDTDSQFDNTETPLIIPDILPTDNELGDTTTDGDQGVKDPGNDESRINVDGPDRGSGSSDGESSNDEGEIPSLIPFP